jgi:hypothetical protein
MEFSRPANLLETLRRLPTTDLYLVNPLIGTPAQIRILGRNIYGIGETAIVSRYASAEDVEQLRRLSPGRVVYIADDDFVAGMTDPNLPDNYRAKLASFASEIWPLLRQVADTSILPTEVLASAYGGDVRVVQPTWHREPPPIHHFDDAGDIRIAYLGTASHAADLGMIVPALLRVLARHPRARLTHFLGASIPAALTGHPQIVSRRPLPWWLYKRLLPRMRFHLALYPLQDTPFNRARSANKLLETAQVGAAALMSPNPALLGYAGPGLQALFVTGGLEQWEHRLDEALADVTALRNGAEEVRARVVAVHRAGEASAVWKKILADDLPI